MHNRNIKLCLALGPALREQINELWQDNKLRSKLLMIQKPKHYRDDSWL